MTAQNPATPPSKAPKIIAVIGIVLLAIIIAGGSFLFAGVSRVADAIPTPDDFVAAIEPEPYLEVTPAVVRSVQAMAELTTVEMTEFAIVEKGTDEGWLQWARGDSVRLMAVADIGAGVDLAGLEASDISVDETGIVEVRVPSAEIQYIAVDNEATQVLERDKGLFTKGDPQLESEAREIAETYLHASALEAGILQDAERNTRTALTNLLLGLGYSEVVVSFEAGPATTP